MAGVPWKKSRAWCLQEGKKKIFISLRVRRLGAFTSVSQQDSLTNGGWVLSETPDQFRVQRNGHADTGLHAERRLPGRVGRMLPAEANHLLHDANQRLGSRSTRALRMSLRRPSLCTARPNDSARRPGEPSQRHCVRSQELTGRKKRMLTLEQLATSSPSSLWRYHWTTSSTVMTCRDGSTPFLCHSPSPPATPVQPHCRPVCLPQVQDASSPSSAGPPSGRTWTMSPSG